MRFYVKVKTRASQERIEEFGDHRYLVYVKEVATHNDANIAMLNLMAKHLGVPAMKLKIIAGLTNAEKVLEIN